MTYLCAVERNKHDTATLNNTRNKMKLTNRYFWWWLRS